MKNIVNQNTNRENYNKNIVEDLNIKEIKENKLEHFVKIILVHNKVKSNFIFSVNQIINVKVKVPTIVGINNAI